MIATSRLYGLFFASIYTDDFLVLDDQNFSFMLFGQCILILEIVLKFFF